MWGLDGWGAGVGRRMWMEVGLGHQLDERLCNCRAWELAPSYSPTLPPTYFACAELAAREARSPVCGVASLGC